MLTGLCDRAAEQLDLKAITQTEEERQRNEQLSVTLDKLDRARSRTVPTCLAMTVHGPLRLIRAVTPSYASAISKHNDDKRISHAKGIFIRSD